MAQQNINVGTAPNDGTGDTLKTSFTKCNANFTELYGSFAPLASPTFTGDPKAPTPTAGDNDTSIATTAFVTAAVAAISRAFGPPQGRLTLQSLTPVMTTTQSAKTTIYFSAYVGSLCPIYDGIGTFTMQNFGYEISTTTTDTTKNPSAIGASKCNDWFVWNDVGTMRLCHGPDWTNDTTRAAALNRVNGIWLNPFNITNGPAAGTGTYVGTTRSNASSRLDWIFGATDVAGFFSVWNMYNRVRVASASKDSTANWTYGSSIWRQSNNNARQRCTFVDGVGGGIVQACYSINGNLTSTVAAVSIGLNATSAPHGDSSAYINQSSGLNQTWIANLQTMTGLGVSFTAAIEFNQTANAVTFYGYGANPSLGCQPSFQTVFEA